MTTGVKRATVIFLLSLLTGCAATSPPQETARCVTARAYQDKIGIGGRLSMRYEQGGKEQAMHGSFAWDQAADHAVVAVLSPLGQILAEIEVNPTESVLRQAGQVPRAASDVDQLAQEALGWPLPVAGLREWLQGYATDTTGRRFMATPQATTVDTRDGWRIRYLGWQEEDGSSSHPKRIDLERHTAQAGDIVIKIMIDTWRID